MAKQARKAAKSQKTADKKASKTSAKAGKKSAAKKLSAKKPSAEKPSGKTLKPGDKVTWGTSQGQTRGRVVKKQTTPTQIKTHKVAASKDNPQYIVESGKSGKRAAHKAGELRKTGK